MSFFCAFQITNVSYKLLRLIKINIYKNLQTFANFFSLNKKTKYLCIIILTILKTPTTHEKSILFCIFPYRVKSP